MFVILVGFFNLFCLLNVLLGFFLLVFKVLLVDFMGVDFECIDVLCLGLCLFLFELFIIVDVEVILKKFWMFRNRNIML